MSTLVIPEVLGIPQGGIPCREPWLRGNAHQRSRHPPYCGVQAPLQWEPKKATHDHQPEDGSPFLHAVGLEGGTQGACYGLWREKRG